MYTIIDKRVIVFGTFELSEEKIKNIVAHFPDGELAMGKDQKGNVAARIQAPTYIIELTKERLFVLVATKADANDRADVLTMIDHLAVLLDGVVDYGMNRLAFNSQAFIEDRDGAKRVYLGSKVPLLKTESPMIETSVRLNYREEFMGEDINNVISVQDGIVHSKENEGDAIKSLLMLADINTVSTNLQVRFDKASLEPMLLHFLELANKSFADIDEELM